jgi:hypothetical protein
MDEPLGVFPQRKKGVTPKIRSASVDKNEDAVGSPATVVVGFRFFIKTN